MAEQPVNQNNPDEIDLGQLFQMIGNWFNKLGIGFLHLFLYLKKNAFILAGLVVLGVGIGYGLNQIIEKSQKIEVIVKPNLDSENYLYDVVDEIENNIKARDTLFFRSIGISTERLAQYRIWVEPIEQKKNEKEDLAYLELLEKFQSEERFSDFIRKELLKNSTLNHRITFKFKENAEGEVFAQKIMEYINSAEYFKDLVNTSNENAKNRIEQNNILISQIDLLISKYTEHLDKGDQLELNRPVLLENDEPIDVTGLLRFKNLLIENTEAKRIEMRERSQVINVINFGKPQVEKKPFFGKNWVLFPVIFIGIFFLWEFIKYLNRKSMEL